MTLLALPLAAFAQTPARQLALHYEVDGTMQGCPSAAELQASIGQQLGYDPFADSPGSPRGDVRITIARQGGGAEARIEWFDEHGAVQGERRLTSQDHDCPELAAGVAFATAVQLQLLAASAPPPAPPPPPAPRERVRPPAATSPSRTVLVGAGGLARIGGQPGVAPGLRAFASVGSKVWGFQLDAHATAATATEGAAGGFSARELGLGAAPCFRRGVLDACALGSLTLLSVRGEGVDQPKNPSAVGLGLGLRLQLTLPWHERLAAILHGDLLAQLTPRDVMLNREPVWSTSPITVALGLDVAAIFR